LSIKNIRNFIITKYFFGPVKFGSVSPFLNFEIFFVTHVLKVSYFFQTDREVFQTEVKQLSGKQRNVITSLLKIWK